ncbi:hypothetical protein CCYA_CCYA06G1796 [Cyanidiococcus yangmingshanensis]|nr:hypothetical protein CCYA_CCYA06G1796 [Cyanidiococcus yangmingshanensis]
MREGTGRRFPRCGLSTLRHLWNRRIDNIRMGRVQSGDRSSSFECIGDDRVTGTEQALDLLACASAVCTRHLGPLFVFFAMALIGLIVFTYFRYMLPALYQIAASSAHTTRTRVAVSVHLAASMHLLFCVLYSYLRTVCTNPGSPPLAAPNQSCQPSRPSWFENEDASACRSQERGWPVCSRCGCWRPPRTHHCSVCRRCVLHMDHHCIWMNACVGYYNYGSFLSTLYFLVLGATDTVGTVLYIWMRAPSRSELRSNIWVLYSFVLALCLGLALFALLAFHAWILSLGLSTIDYLAGHPSELTSTANFEPTSTRIDLEKPTPTVDGYSTSGRKLSRWRCFRANARALFGRHQPLWRFLVLPSFTRRLGDPYEYRPDQLRQVV